MRLESRIKKLEQQANINEGFNYFVRFEGGKFTVKANGADITEDIELSENEFAKWENTIAKNSQVYVISRYETDVSKD